MGRIVTRQMRRGCGGRRGATAYYPPPRRVRPVASHSRSPAEAPWDR